MNYTPDSIINDRYRLVRKIGAGSFGEVWLAKDTKVEGIEVAIKFYVALDSRGLDDFTNEFRNTHDLLNPHLLRVDYFDVDGNRPYLIMPFCPSSSSSLVGNASEEQLWRFLSHVSSGLNYLHDHDILHRDIKPDNVLMDRDDNFVITDFGLSMKLRSTLRSASSRQNHAEVSGSVSYMAPELFSSKPMAVNATDIWALGASAYELATGSLPFFGQGGVMELHGAEVPDLPDNYSPALNSIVKACLAKETWDRPVAAHIHSVAEKALGNDQPYTPPIAPWEKSKKTDIIQPKKIKPRVVISVVIAALVLGGVAYMLFNHFHNAGENVVQADTAVVAVTADTAAIAVEQRADTASATSTNPQPPKANHEAAAITPMPPTNAPQPQSVQVPDNQNTDRRRQEARENLQNGLARVILPVDCGSGVTMHNISIDDDYEYISFLFKVDEDELDIYQINSNKQEVGREMYNQLKSSGDKNLKILLQEAKAAGISSLIIKLKGNETGATASIPVNL